MKTSLVVYALTASLAASGAFAQAPAPMAPLSAQDRVVVKEYVIKNKHPSAKFTGSVVIGEALPPDVQFYSVEGPATVTKYRYTIVNDRMVLVDPTSRKIIEIIE